MDGSGAYGDLRGVDDSVQAGIHPDGARDGYGRRIGRHRDPNAEVRIANGGIVCSQNTEQRRGGSGCHSRREADTHHPRGASVGIQSVDPVLPQRVRNSSSRQGAIGGNNTDSGDPGFGSILKTIPIQIHPNEIAHAAAQSGEHGVAGGRGDDAVILNVGGIEHGIDRGRVGYGYIERQRRVNDNAIGGGCRPDPRS